MVHGGIIDPSAFQVYLYAWRALDLFNYTAPPCTILPDPGLRDNRLEPPRRAGGPADLYPLPQAPPIQLVQTSFFARGYGDVTEQIGLVKKIRALTDEATAQGVPVFPTGLPFTMTEQYLHFWQHLVIASGIALGAVLVAGLIFLPNPVAALLAVCLGGGGAVSACLLGLLALDLGVNIISGGLLLISFGLGTKLASGVLCGWYGPQHNIHRETGRPLLVMPETKMCEEEDVYHNDAYNPRIRLSKKLTAVLQNHTSHALHSSVSLVLAVALLAAVRVEFIAE